ncbi:MAG: Type 1 glutamine amidotransferase-like domain-containing protein [Planctomycetaceae bacterium]|nr:Type 1 glutamine amidotransferase-like domain-containing protein [Planctomycetaceae bacterium]
MSVVPETFGTKVANSARELNHKALNPFGIPEPDNPERPGIVVLHGGGDTDEMIDVIPKLTRREKPILVHCPAARESCRPSTRNDADLFQQFLETEFSVWNDLVHAGRLSRISFLTTNTPRDAKSKEFVEPLTQADAVWFCGGDQGPLASLFVDRLQPTLFQTELHNVLRRGGVVGGSSAGLAIMADLMIEGGQQKNGAPAVADLSRGLGVLKHVLAEQHFDARKGRIERLTNLLRDHKRIGNHSAVSEPHKLIGLAVEEDTALICQMNRLRVTGRKLAHVFIQSPDPRRITWHALKPGDEARIVASNREWVLELEDWQLSP